MLGCQMVVYLGIEMTQDYSKSWARNEHWGLDKIGFSDWRMIWGLAHDNCAGAREERMQWDSSMSLRRVVEITRRCKNCCLPVALRFWPAEWTSKIIPVSIKCLFYAWHFAVCHIFLPFCLSHILCENEQQSQVRVRVRLLALSTGGILLPSPNSLKEQKAGHLKVSEKDLFRIRISPWPWCSLITWYMHLLAVFHNILWPLSLWFEEWTRSVLWKR